MAFWKLWLRRGLAIFVLLLVVIASVLAGLLLPYLLAAWSAKIWLLTLSSVCAFAVIAWGGAWLGALIWRAERLRKFAGSFSALWSMVFVIALYVLVLRPHPLRLTEAIRPDNTRYWRLSTGSRIAYNKYDPPAGTPVRSEPILFLHGGPGMPVGPWDHLLLSPLAESGFRVFLFDQAGCGFSDFLPVRDYTVARAVADVEAIRQEIGADKIILIGHSWGSTLAANYLAKHPDHVARVVFYSPGPMWNFEEGQAHVDFSRTDGGAPAFPSLRMLAAWLLLERNRDAAQNLLPQPEGEELLVPFIAPAVGTLVCKGDRRQIPPLMRGMSSDHLNPHLNPLVLASLGLSATNAADDPHAALRGNKTPVMILFGECDYLPWSGALDYRKTLGNAQAYYIPRAGHFIVFEQPDLMRRTILSFLFDQPDSMPSYTGDADPRTVNP
ncbi:MAG TPA: alpha/beta hydrolase [Terriglobales bacterium]